MKALFFGALVLLLATGCSAFVREVPLTPGEPTAEITIVRESGFVGGGTTLTVTVDDQEVLALWAGEYATLRVPAGERLLGVIYPVQNRRTIRESLQAGRRYFYLLTISMSTGPALVPITDLVGQRLIRETAERRLETPPWRVAPPENAPPASAPR